MFRSYNHHQAEKDITTLGLLNCQRIRFQHDDGRTTETCSYVYISNILTYDGDVA
jgi:hypothetical protein